MTVPSSLRASTVTLSGRSVTAREWYRTASNGEGTPRKMSRPSWLTWEDLPWTGSAAGPTVPP